MRPIPVRRLHHHDVGCRRYGGIAEQRPPAAANVSGEQHAAPYTGFLELELNAGRAQDVSRVHERRAHSGKEVERPSILYRGAEVRHRLFDIVRSVERRGRLGPRLLPFLPLAAPARVALEEMRRIQHHQLRQLP